MFSKSLNALCVLVFKMTYQSNNNFSIVSFLRHHKAEIAFIYDKQRKENHLASLLD